MVCYRISNWIDGSKDVNRGLASENTVSRSGQFVARLRITGSFSRARYMYEQLKLLLLRYAWNIVNQNFS